MATGAARRRDERVTSLELFFDLVFVLAITQCTAVMVSEHSWRGLAKGLLVLAAMWWSWVAYEAARVADERARLRSSPAGNDASGR